MRAAIVSREGVDLVDDDDGGAAEQGAGRNPRADQHRLQRLGCGEQNVRRISQEPLARAGGDISVPLEDPSTDDTGVPTYAIFLVVQERADGRQVDDGDWPKVPGVHGRQD